MVKKQIRDKKKLIHEHQRRLQKLNEQKARFGIRTDPEILNEIEDIEVELEKLQRELKLLEESNSTNPQQTSSESDFRASSDQILLVDDNHFWREQLGGFLEDSGYRVITAASKEAAIQCITNNKNCDLAIIDMRLNEEDEDDRDGITLGIWLRDNGYDLPIIIMSGYDMDIEIVKKATLRPFQFAVVGKNKIGAGGPADLMKQIELAIGQIR